MASRTYRCAAGCHRLPARLFITLVGLPLAALLSCCTADGNSTGVLALEIDGIRADASVLNFKLYRADCFGTHPCDTWLAQTNYSSDQSNYQLSLPPEVRNLSIYLRVETTVTGSSCVGARATATTAQTGADYAGTSIKLALDKDALGPPFLVTMPNACPFSYRPQGTGQGSVTISWAEHADITDPNLYPDEILRMTLVTATATQNSGSRFTMWASPPGCAGRTQTTCAFYMNEGAELSPVFEMP